MTPHDFSKLPTYAQLPVKPGAPAGSSWSVFGEDDEFGCLNFLTPEGLVAAAKLVESGKTFRLDAKIGFADPPLFGRAKVRHQIVKLGPYAHDDLLDNYNTQESSQWDGFAHVGHFKHERFYGGVTVDQIKSGPGGRLSIHHWAAKFAGRGVLIDAYGYRKAFGKTVDPMQPGEYGLDELKAVLAWQGTTLTPGSIMLVRTGWMEAYDTLSAETKQSFTKFENIKAMGVERSRALVEWLWNNQVAAIGCDNPAVESLPFDLGDEEALHYLALPLLGLSLGELFVLAPLAEDCARDKRYEFLLVSAPMNLVGGIASPPNAVVVK
jgi:kynurenine formamidase